MTLLMRDQENVEKGIELGVKKTAVRMLNTGKYTLEEIADITGLSLEEVKSLKH